MSELDDLLDEVLTEEGEPATVPPSSVSISTADAQPPERAEEPEALPARSDPVDPTAPASGFARRGQARQRMRSGACPMYAPAGTVCKTCGKVHPL